MCQRPARHSAMQISNTRLCNPHCRAAVALLPASTAFQGPFGRPSLPMLPAYAAPAWLHLLSCTTDPHLRFARTAVLACLTLNLVKLSSTLPLLWGLLPLDWLMFLCPFVCCPCPLALQAWHCTCCPGCGQLSCTITPLYLNLLQHGLSFAELCTQPECARHADCIDWNPVSQRCRPGGSCPDMFKEYRSCQVHRCFAHADSCPGQCCSWEPFPLCSGASLIAHSSRLTSLSPSAWSCQGHPCPADAAARSRPPHAVGPA